ncbi:hypothetical protein HMPREF9056_02396 [Actinomyces sp. oral taxon 170 str. F0386]|nr:hypothetical protein HMPREF9056_02396 [Actinomyces sp. oral taxon 170 str. F0386]
MCVRSGGLRSLELYGGIRKALQSVSAHSSVRHLAVTKRWSVM